MESPANVSLNRANLGFSPFFEPTARFIDLSSVPRFPGPPRVSSIYPAFPRFPGPARVSSIYPAFPRFPGPPRVSSLSRPSARFIDLSSVSSLSRPSARFIDLSSLSSLSRPTTRFIDLSSPPRSSSRRDGLKIAPDGAQRNPGNRPQSRLPAPEGRNEPPSHPNPDSQNCLLPLSKLAAQRRPRVYDVQSLPKTSPEVESERRPGRRATFT